MMNAYERKGRGGQLLLTRQPTKAVYPERPSGVKDLLCHSARTLAPQRHSRQTGEPCPRHSLLLDEHLEPFSHPFGVDQRLELQTRFCALGLALSFIVQVCKFISLSERQQKRGL